ncbi:HlyD family type I secretion periplasmic adaptor subunit (plasmid) [Burkholderia gladioli]
MWARIQAIFAIIQRYSSVLSEAWQARTRGKPESRRAHELAFLPAHLELLETPAHPAAHWLIRVIALFVVVSVLTALFGRLDIVVLSKGKLVPNSQVKIVQPATTGVIREILVKDGQRVVAGDVLIRLDTRQATADAQKAQNSRIDAALAQARSRALLIAQRLGRAPQVEAVDGASAARQAQAQAFAEGVWIEYKAKLASAAANLQKIEAELETTRRGIEKLEATAPLARRQADDYKSLVGEKYVAESDYLEKEQAAVSQQHELAAQRSRSRELEASVLEQRAQVRAVQAAFESTQLTEQEKATEELIQSHDDETKSKAREGFLTLVAPVAGTVQQLAIHTLGGVVTTAQSLMEIVPDDALEAHVTIDNKDVGFVEIGQKVAIKVDAFPYSRYGMIEGRVKDVSNDAIQDRKQGLVYSASISLKTNKLWVGHKWIMLTPGMSVTAEIRTGTQSVAHYFLGPVVEGVQESMHER